MIDIIQQEKMFIAIGNILEKKVTVYAIGGTAMMLKGIKDSTLDVDFVFDMKSDRDEFISALRKLEAKESDVTLVYGLKENCPFMLELENVRFDLFTNKIISSVFSKKMKERAKQTDEFGKNLVIKSADPHDIIIMKCVTSRAKDLTDISIIFKKTAINWDIIVGEAEEQVRLGNEKAILLLGEKLEKLNNSHEVAVPQLVLDRLWKLLKKQVREKAKKAD